MTIYEENNAHHEGRGAGGRRGTGHRVQSIQRDSRGRELSDQGRGRREKAGLRGKPVRPGTAGRNHFHRSPDSAPCGPSLFLRAGAAYLHGAAPAELPDAPLCHRRPAGGRTGMPGYGPTEQGGRRDCFDL